jgi:gamma-glutamylcyclotransferase (GGCT)/AIG2-like uncharacterized protein YtfP
MTLYFAYGANMDRAAMARRCPTARPLGPAVLEGYRFIITADGYASVVPTAGAVVHGILWRLTPRDLAALNIFESVDSGLYRRVLMPVRIGGRRVRAMLYRGRGRATGTPRPGYIATLVAAARGWALPSEHVDRLRRWAPGAFGGRAAAESGAIA